MSHVPFLSTANANSLTLHNLQAPFLLILIMLAFSLVIFCIELVMGFIDRLPKKAKMIPGILITDLSTPPPLSLPSGGKSGGVPLQPPPPPLGHSKVEEKGHERQEGREAPKGLE